MDMVTNILLQMTNTPKTTATSDVPSPKTEDFRTMLTRKQNAKADMSERPEAKAETAEDAEGVIADETADVMSDEALSMANAMAVQNVILFPMRTAATEEQGDAEAVAMAPMPMQSEETVMTAEMPAAVQTDAVIEVSSTDGQSAEQPTFAVARYEVPVVEVKAERVQERPEAETEAKADVDTEVWQSVKTIRVVSAGTESKGTNARSEGEADTEENAEMTAAMSFKPLFRDVEAAPVKVGEMAVVDTTVAEMDEQMSRTIMTALANGTETIEIRLTPESLGSVTIQLRHTESGALQVVMSADSERAQTILAKHAPNLQNLLMDGGRENVQVEVRQPQNEQRQDLFEQQNRQQQNQQQQNPRHSRQRSEDFLQQLRLGLVSLDAEAI